jgi:hypothetical protein
LLWLRGIAMFAEHDWQLWKCRGDIRANRGTGAECDSPR